MHKLRAMAALGLVVMSSVVACNNGSGATSPVPGGVVTASPTTPPPTILPSATATATTSARPSATPSGSPTAAPTSTAVSVACSVSRASFGPTFTALVVEANVPAGGGNVTPIAGGALWTTETFNTATSPPTSSPTPVPTPTATPALRPFSVYTGTYHVTSTTAPTDGCFSLISTVDGTAIRGQTFSSVGTGSPNPPTTPFTVTTTGTGSITSFSLTVSPTAPMTNGTFTLSNGDTGTIAITAVQTVQLPLSGTRIPQ